MSTYHRSPASSLLMHLWTSSRGQKGSTQQSQWESDHHDLIGQLGARNEKTPSDPRPTNAHTPQHPASPWTTEAAMGIWECGRVGIGIRLQELKESGCVWNSGSCLSLHIPHYSRNNKLCQSRYNSRHSGYLTPQKSLKHPKPHANLQNSADNILKRWRSCEIIKVYYI